jgi:hypothetical protein
MPYNVGVLLIDAGQIYAAGLPTLSGALNVPALGAPSTATSALPGLNLPFAPLPNPPGSPGNLLVSDPAGPGDFYRSGPIAHWPPEPVSVNAGTGVLPLSFSSLAAGIALPINQGIPGGATFGIGVLTGFLFMPFRISITRLVLGRSSTPGAIRARLSGIINFVTLFIPRRTDFTATLDITLTPSGDAGDPDHIFDLRTSNLSLSTGFTSPLSTPAIALLAPAFAGALAGPLSSRVNAAIAPMIATVRAAAASGAGLNLFSSRATVSLRRITVLGAGLVVQALLSDLQGAPAVSSVSMLAAAPLADGRLELWAVTAADGLSSTWKLTTDSRSDWAPWFDFLAYRGALPAAVREVAMAPLSDGRLQSWVVTATGGVFCTWKETTDPDSEWASWFDFLAYRGALTGTARQIALGRLSDGRLESFVVTQEGGVFTTWQVGADPNAEWAPWADFLAEAGAVAGGVRQVAVAPLPDGRLELWAVTQSGGILSSWKETPDPNANWAQWFDFLAYRPGLPAPVRQVAMAPLQDGRLEAWAVTSNGDLFSTWKVDTDPNADWEPWMDFIAEVGALPAPVRSVTVAPLSDGRLTVWVVTTTGGVYATSKVNADPNGNWGPWANFLLEP